MNSLTIGEWQDEQSPGPAICSVDDRLTQKPQEQMVAEGGDGGDCTTAAH